MEGLKVQVEVADMLKKSAEAVVAGAVSAEDAADWLHRYAGLPRDWAHARVLRHVDELRQGGGTADSDVNVLRQPTAANVAQLDVAVGGAGPDVRDSGVIVPPPNLRLVEGEPVEYRDVKVSTVEASPRLEDLVYTAVEGADETHSRFLTQEDVIRRGLAFTGMSVETWNGAQEGERRALLDAELDDIRRYAARNSARAAAEVTMLAGEARGKQS